MRLDMSRPVLMTHFAPRDCKSPIRSSSFFGLGGSSNSAKSVPSKSVERHKAEQIKPKEQLVHTNLSLFYMKAGDKQKAEHHGLQARIASWREDAANAKSPTTVSPGDPELAMAKPQAAPVKPPEKFPD